MSSDIQNHPEHGHGPFVHINVDDDQREIKRGHYEISALKHELGVPPDYEFDLVVNGVFEPLADDVKIKIAGGEVFISHVRRGGSS